MEQQQMGIFFCWCTISTLISKPSWWWINFPMVGNKRVGKCPHFSFKLVIYLMKGLLIRIIIVRSIPMAPSPVTCQKSNFKIKSDTKFTFLQCVHKIANFLSFTFKSESLFCWVAKILGCLFISQSQPFAIPCGSKLTLLSNGKIHTILA